MFREGGVQMQEVQKATTHTNQQAVKIEEIKIVDKTSQELSLQIRVHNEAKQRRTGVIKIYIRDMNSIYATSVPVLYTFETLELEAQEAKTVVIRVYAEAFIIVDEKGDRYRDSNDFEIHTCIDSVYSKRQLVKRKVQFQSVDEEEFFI